MSPSSQPTILCGILLVDLGKAMKLNTSLVVCALSLAALADEYSGSGQCDTAALCNSAVLMDIPLNRIRGKSFNN